MKIKERLSKPTPKLWRRVGRSLTATGTALTGLLIYSEHEYWATLAILCTIIGTFLTNLAVDEKA